VIAIHDIMKTMKQTSREKGFKRLKTLVQATLKIKRSWVQILFHPTLDGSGVKAMPAQFMYPILDHLQKERKNISRKMG